jgi:hypothetical protein
VLTMSLFWTCGVLLVPVFAFYWFITDFIPMPGDDSSGGGYGDSNCGTPEPEPAPEPPAGPSAQSIELQVTQSVPVYFMKYTGPKSVIKRQGNAMLTRCAVLILPPR